MAEYSPYKNKFKKATREGLVTFKTPEKKLSKGKRDAENRNTHKAETPQSIQPEKVAAPSDTSYNSAYLQNINSALKNINNAKPFEYDYSSDKLYDQYKKSYERSADLAARDAKGKASALTGGYNNTYAQTVSQQVQTDALTKLSDKIPELYEMAYNRYRDSKADEMDKLYALLDVDKAQFEKYLDAENLALDKKSLAYKMQSDTSKTKTDASDNKSSEKADTTATKPEQTGAADTEIQTTPSEEEAKQQSVLKLTQMYKEYSDYIYDDTDREDVAQEIMALCYIGAITDSEADTLINALKLQSFVS